MLLVPGLLRRRIQMLAQRIRRQAGGLFIACPHPFMKQEQRAVQPGAEVALFHIAGQLGRFAQAQLVEGEKAVGADAQGVVTAGRETEHGQPLALRLRPLCGLSGYVAPVAWIGSRGDGP